jgi:hypothetical protein
VSAVLLSSGRLLSGAARHGSQCSVCCGADRWCPSLCCALYAQLRPGVGRYDADPSMRVIVYCLIAAHFVRVCSYGRLKPCCGSLVKLRQFWWCVRLWLIWSSAVRFIASTNHAVAASMGGGRPLLPASHCGGVVAHASHAAGLTFGMYTGIVVMQQGSVTLKLCTAVLHACYCTLGADSEL